MYIIVIVLFVVMSTVCFNSSSDTRSRRDHQRSSAGSAKASSLHVAQRDALVNSRPRTLAKRGSMCEYILFFAFLVFICVALCCFIFQFRRSFLGRYRHQNNQVF